MCVRRVLVILNQMLHFRRMHMMFLIWKKKKKKNNNSCTTIAFSVNESTVKMTTFMHKPQTMIQHTQTHTHTSKSFVHLINWTRDMLIRRAWAHFASVTVSPFHSSFKFIESFAPLQSNWTENEMAVLCLLTRFNCLHFNYTAKAHFLCDTHTKCVIITPNGMYNKSHDSFTVCLSHISKF